jgi:photosystem II stability/assembly factor-like uncharacterized protein
MMNKLNILYIFLMCVGALLAAGCNVAGVLGNPNVPFYNAPGPASGQGISISSVSPALGFSGDAVTITGSGFGVEKGDGSITFGAASATETSWSNTSIVVPVPSSAVTSAITVKNNSGNSVTSTGSFGVLQWSTQTSTTSNDLNGISFVNENFGMAVGRNRLLWYRDGAWSQAIGPDSRDIRAVSMVSTTMGCAVGGNVTDGYLWLFNGTAWTPTNGTLFAGNFLNGVHFIDANNGWICGDGGFIRNTTNGGGAWNAQVSPVNKSLKAVWFVDGNNGWIAGADGTILNTSNGGGAWAQQTSNTTNALFAVHMESAADGWAVGANGTVLHYTGGAWTASQVGGASLRTVFFLNANQGWIGGTDGAVFYTENGGATWKQEDPGTSQTITGLFFFARNLGWASAGSGNIKYCHQIY